MNDTYDIANAVNPNEGTESQSEQRGVVEDKSGEQSITKEVNSNPVETAAALFADLFWDQYLYNKRFGSDCSGDKDSSNLS